MVTQAAAGALEPPGGGGEGRIAGHDRREERGGAGVLAGVILQDHRGAVTPGVLLRPVGERLGAVDVARGHLVPARLAVVPLDREGDEERVGARIERVEGERLLEGFPGGRWIGALPAVGVSASAARRTAIAAARAGSRAASIWAARTARSATGSPRRAASRSSARCGAWACGSSAVTARQAFSAMPAAAGGPRATGGCRRSR